MNKFENEVRKILADYSLSTEDKLISINAALPKEGEPFITNIFGNPCEVRSENGSIIIDGSIGSEYVDHPRLKTPSDAYYSCGTTWGIDLDGKRYWLLNKDGSIYNERERLRRHQNENKKNK